MGKEIETGSPVLPFDGVIKGYTIKFLKKNEWRSAGYLEFEDLLQEAYTTYMVIVRKYASSVENQAHFMSLYKSALRNKITDISTQANNYRTHQDFTSVDEENNSLIEQLPGELENHALCEINIGQAPAPVSAVINYLTQERSTVESTREFWRHQEYIWCEVHNKKKFLGNEYLCSRLGYDHTTVDLVGMTQDYLKG